MNVLPRHYLDAINRQIDEEREIEKLNEKVGIRSSGIVAGLEMAKTIITKTFRAKQEIFTLKHMTSEGGEIGSFRLIVEARERREWSEDGIHLGGNFERAGNKPSGGKQVVLQVGQK